MPTLKRAGSTHTQKRQECFSCSPLVSEHKSRCNTHQNLRRLEQHHHPRALKSAPKAHGNSLARTFLRRNARWNDTLVVLLLDWLLHPSVGQAPFLFSTLSCCLDKRCVGHLAHFHQTVVKELGFHFVPVRRKIQLKMQWVLAKQSINWCRAPSTFR